MRTSAGVTRDVSLRGRVKHADATKLAVGDDVIIERDERATTWAIVEILPRRSSLSRRAPGRRQAERVVAANVDQVLVVVAAARPDPHPGMIDRFLLIAEANDLPARIIVNKVELVDESVTAQLLAPYRAAGYGAHMTSVRTGAGLPALEGALVGRTSVLSGPSGVGKSSLMNALYPGLALRVGEISDSVNKGRHTTVGALLHPLPAGGFVVDTPGLREVGLWGIDPGEVDRCFPEFRPRLGHCRFADCRHTVEPGCAVRAAVGSGGITAGRYESYVKLRGELEESSGVW